MSINRMLSWFPRAWRARYEAEVRELLQAREFSWRERRDLMQACIDAWARELWSWAYAVSRFAGAAGIRVAVLLAVGWIGLQLVTVFAGLEFTQAVAARGGSWVSAVTEFRIPFTFVLQLFLARPYADSGSSIDRPSWTQTIALTSMFVVLSALDERGGPVRQLPDMICLSLTATMRYARWFVVLDTRPPTANQTRTILGLR